MAVQLAVVIAEAAADVALVGFADGAQARAGQAGAAALRELLRIAHEIRAAADILQPGNLRTQIGNALLLGQLNLAEHRQGNLLLAGHEGLILGQLSEKAVPHQRVALGNLHIHMPPYRG